MALINCPECKKEVSDAAPTCPNCGVPIAGAKEGKAAGGQRIRPWGYWCRIFVSADRFGKV